MSTEEEEYNARVKKRVLILKQMLEDGSIKIPKGTQIEQSLANARFDSNGEPDLSTIDGVIRSMALLAENLQYRKDVKNEISLIEIQSKYFEILETNFGFFYDRMIKDDVNPEIVARTIAYGQQDITPLDNTINVLLEILIEFWSALAEPAFFHLEDEHDTIKAIFGGDMFPSYAENVASKCGIYTDTIILPCPFIRCRYLFERWDKQQRVYYLLKHVLNVLQYKSLALANLDVPIVVVLPEKEMIEVDDFKRVQELGGDDALYHAEKLFGRKFDSLEELFDFAGSLNTVEKVVKEIKDPSKVLFDTEMEGTISKQIEEQVNGMSSQLLGVKNPGVIVASLGLGRMGTCNELLIKANRLRGIPLIDAPTSWEYFKWKLEYDAERKYDGQDITGLHIVKGLNHLADTEFRWIGKIPPEGLIELRKTGALNEIRSILSKGIKDLASEEENDFVSTSHKVFNNINRAFIDHEKSIKELQNKKWKVAGKDLSSFLVIGSIELAAACLGQPLWGAGAFAVDQITDAPKVKDLPKTIKKIKDIKEEQEIIKKSPVGLMFKYKNT
jgi:hypothetical protein